MVAQARFGCTIEVSRQYGVDRSGNGSAGDRGCHKHLPRFSGFDFFRISCVWGSYSQDECGDCSQLTTKAIVSNLRYPTAVSTNFTPFHNFGQNIDSQHNRVQTAVETGCFSRQFCAEEGKMDLLTEKFIDTIFWDFKPEKMAQRKTIWCQRWSHRSNKRPFWWSQQIARFGRSQKILETLD